MKKYTAPEIEIIKFRIQEAIADDETDDGFEGTTGPSVSGGVGDLLPDETLPGRG